MPRPCSRCSSAWAALACQVCQAVCRAAECPVCQAVDPLKWLPRTHKHSSVVCSLPDPKHQRVTRPRI